MKPKILHQEAMEYSFKAKQALVEGRYGSSFELYKKAAELESHVADFYFDKPELEPTRSIVIRSAAYLNLKAGQIESAKKFIFFGLLYTQDKLIQEQLNNALELAVSFGNMAAEKASAEFSYINLLRQRSIHYIIEPANPAFGRSISLANIKDFTEGYLKSLKAYAVSKFRRIIEIEEEISESAFKEVEKIVNPLVTSSAYGSFKFSVANDFLAREGEKREILDFKANVVSKYHNEVFINPLEDNDIEFIKKNYSEDEVNEIFRPLSKIKSNNTPYKVGYYDSESFSKKFVNPIVNKQRQKLLTVKPVTQEDIGELESSITHKRNTQSGRIHKTTILKEQLKKYEFDVSVNQIEPKDNSPLILNEDILLSVVFNSEIGFTVSFEDLRIEYTDVEYSKTLKDFQTLLFNKVVTLANNTHKTEEEQRDWEVVKRLIGNPDSLKK